MQPTFEQPPVMSPEYQAQQIIANAEFNQIMADEARLAQEEANSQALGLFSLSLFLNQSNPELSAKLVEAAAIAIYMPQLKAAAAEEQFAINQQHEVAARMYHGTNGDEGSVGRKSNSGRSRKSNLVNA